MILGIPTLNRYDLLYILMTSAERGTERPTKYLIVDNGGRFVPPDMPFAPRISVLRQSRNIGVAAAWNRMLRYAHDQGEPIVISNDDVELAPRNFEEIAGALRSGAPFASGLGWALFAQTPSCTESVGLYDENFYPAYYEDRDYELRMRRCGVAKWDVSMSDGPVRHVGWATSRALPSMDEHYSWYGRNLAYFIQKWGGPPGSETFTEAFDGRPPEGWKLTG